MDIGNQIKALRLRRGVTQDALAQHLGITAQSVSKWECGASAPDIALLPELSAYFGVSIDELFAMSDEKRMERIQNMLWDVRFIDSADIENERRFLLDKLEREPYQSKAAELLAKLELHLAEEHKVRAEEFARESLRREPDSYWGYTALCRAMGGKDVDLRGNLHNALISELKERIAAHPKGRQAYGWLIAQLIEDRRFEEARRYCDKMERELGDALPAQFAAGFRIKLAIAENDLSAARSMWEALLESYPDDWSVRHDVGDYQTLAGDYAAAKESYRRAVSLMDAPRYTDPVDSLAKVCETDGDYAGAIEARRLELDILEKDWNVATGEEIDRIKREIARLEKQRR